MSIQETTYISRQDAENKALQKLIYQIQLIHTCSNETLEYIIEEDFYNFKIV